MSIKGTGPFRRIVIGNIFYVGADDIACFLIATPQGHIVINSGYEDTPPIVAASVRKLGFRVTDVKFLLNGQAHYDHVAGQAALRKLTGAQVVASAPDARVIESGGRDDPRWGREVTYPRVHVDRVVGDGDEVKIGGAVLAAHMTPGHSVGCTTWSMVTEDKGKHYNVVFVGGTSINPGVRFITHPTYPGIAADYARTFRVLRSLPCDVFLGAHGGYYGMAGKYALLRKGVSPNPFVDRQGYRDFIDRAERDFQNQVAHEQAGLNRRPAKKGSR